MLLVDFPAGVIRAVSQDLEVATAQTRWNQPSAPPIPYEDHSLIFFHAVYSDQASTGLHTADHQNILSLLERGGLIVYFVSVQCQRFHITNVLGDFQWLQLTGAFQPAQGIIPMKIDPYQNMFSIYSHQLIQTIGLSYIPGQDLSYAEQQCRSQGFTAVAFARSTNHLHPVSLVIKFQSRGGIIFFPLFRDDVLPKIFTFVLDEVVPLNFPHLHEPATQSWLEDSRYQMPQVLELIGKRSQVAEEYSNRLGEIDQQISQIKSSEQEPFIQLLTSSGDALKNAVSSALKFAGLFVIDVDEHWKQTAPDRQKEEDLWMGERQFDTHQDAFCLVEVTAEGRGTASDDHCGRILRYLLRRRNEFTNNRIRGLLVVNHQYRTPAHVRRQPFSQKQIDDAIRDGNGLTSTYELFKAVRAEKAGRITKEEIQSALLTQAGLISFPEV